MKNDVISKAGNKAEYVYFIMNGVIHNQSTDRYFEAGQMINHDCIKEKTLIIHDYVAETDVSVLKYDRDTFHLIINQFPDIAEDLKQLIKDKDD